MSMTPGKVSPAPGNPGEGRGGGSSPSLRRVSIKLLAAIFLLSLFIPLLGLCFHWDLSHESNENRRLAEWPALPRTLKDFNALGDSLLDYYRDHFGLRNTLIRAVALTRVRGLGDDTDGSVLMGQNGWLFLRPDGDTNFIATRGLNPLTDVQLDAWQAVLEKRRAWLAAQGIPYLLVIPPDKPTIYPEYLPPQYAPLRPISRLDQLLDRLHESHSPIDFVDVRPALLAAKSSGQLYYRTDTHWNDWGAFIAYQQIIAAVQNLLPQWHIVPQSREDFTPGKLAPWPGDLARMMDMPDKFQDSAIPLLRKKPYPIPDSLSIRNSVVTIDNHDPKLPRIVLYRDSFAIALVPMLGPNFGRIVYAFHYTIDPDLISREKPDLVIDEFLERNLFLDPPKDPPAIGAFKQN
jgi:alginate O-acetyltransferase complex protein AlgJ